MNGYKFVLLCFSLLFINCASSDDGWIDLFNGENLDGWHAYGDDATIDGWYVEDGNLMYDFQRREGGGSSNLVTNDKFTNFELSLEWNIGHHGNSGVFWAVVEDENTSIPMRQDPRSKYWMTIGKCMWRSVAISTAQDPYTV